MIKLGATERLGGTACHDARELDLETRRLTSLQRTRSVYSVTEDQHHWLQPRLSSTFT